MAYSTVRGILHKEGVELRPKSSAVNFYLDSKEYERTIFLYEKVGLSLDDVGKMLGITHGAVQKRLVRMSVPRRPRGTKAKATI